MRKKAPKTQQGRIRKELFGNGRISQDTAIQRETYGKKKKKK
jgi:hypothetical protein